MQNKDTENNIVSSQKFADEGLDKELVTATELSEFRKAVDAVNRAMDSMLARMDEVIKRIENFDDEM